MDEKIRRLSEWAQGNREGPLTLELNPTNRCNLKCVSCWQREFPVNYEGELPKERLISIVQEAAALGVKEIRIPGAGEPLLKEGILDVMQEIKNSGIHGTLITNGTLIDEEKARMIVRMAWDVVTVSIDSPDERTNDELRGNGSLARASEALVHLNKIKSESGKEKPRLRINTVLSKRNCGQLRDIIEFAVRHRVTEVQVQPMTVWGDAGKAIEIGANDLKTIEKSAAEAAEYARQKNVWTNISSFSNTSIVENAAGAMDKQIMKDSQPLQESGNSFLRLPCFEPFYNMIILPDGRVAGCSISGGVDGDTLHNKSLEEIWTGEKFNEIRKSLLSGNLKQYCRKCCSVVSMENSRIRKELAKKISQNNQDNQT